MKKENKKLILGMAIGTLLTGAIGVSAATYFSADQIKFIPANESWNVTNAQEAMNDLYIRSNKNSLTSVFFFTQTSSLTAINSIIPIKVSNNKIVTVENDILTFEQSGTYKLIYSSGEANYPAFPALWKNNEIIWNGQNSWMYQEYEFNVEIGDKIYLTYSQGYAKNSAVDILALIYKI